MAQLFGAIHELTGVLNQSTGGTVGWVIKNRGRHAHAFPDGAAGNEARPAPNPIEETTNGPRPGSGAPRACHQSDPGPIAQGCVPIAGALVHPVKPATKTIEQLELVHSVTLRGSRIQLLGCVHGVSP